MMALPAVPAAFRAARAFAAPFLLAAPCAFAREAATFFAPLLLDAPCADAMAGAVFGALPYAILLAYLGGAMAVGLLLTWRNRCFGHCLFATLSLLLLRVACGVTTELAAAVSHGDPPVCPYLVRSAGRGGADLTVDGDVEIDPGPRSAAMPYPDDFYDPQTRPHDCNRMLLCCLCDSFISRTEWGRGFACSREMYLRDLPATSAAMLWLTAHLPSLDLDDPTCSVAVCFKHKVLMVDSTDTAHIKRTAALCDAANARMDDASTNALRAKASKCNGETCPLCVQVAKARRPFGGGRPRARGGPRPHKAMSFSDDMTPTRTPWSHRHRRASGDAKPVRADTTPSMDDIQAQRQAIGSSSRSFAAGQDTLRARGLPVISGAAARAENTTMNKFFAADCATLPSQSAHDGKVHVVSDLRTFVEKILWIRDKTPADVRLVRISADDGKGSIKVTMSLLFSDDPLLVSGGPTQEQQDTHKKLLGYLDSGVQRTFILALLAGAPESLVTVREVFDQIRWSDLLALLPPSDTLEWVVVMDFKTTAYALGIGQVGSANPYPTSLWSPLVTWNKPNVPRTIQTIVAMDRARREVESAGMMSAKERDNLCRKHQSVKCMPVQLLTFLSGHDLADVLPPPALHILLGVVVTLFDYLCRIDVNTAYCWLEKIAVGHADTHGRTAFKGEHCRTMCRSFAQLKAFTQVRSSRRGDEAPDPVALGSIRKAVRAIARCFECMNYIVSATFGARLAPNWRDAFVHFKYAFAAAMVLVEPYHPRSTFRLPDRHTLKIHCLLVDVPAWIERHGATLIRVSEQTSESSHSLYLAESTHYSIADLTPLKRPSSHLPRKHANEDEPLGPSGGTRAGGARKKRATRDAVRLGESTRPSLVDLTSEHSARIRERWAADGGGFLLEEAPEVLPQSPAVADVSSGQSNKITHAALRRFQSFLSFNAARLSTVVRAQDRLREFRKWNINADPASAPWTLFHLVRT